MNEFEKGLLNYFSQDDLEKIRSVRIGIAGCGGLGSNCAFNLVRSGFRDLVLADLDRVEPSNLNRQFYFLEQVGLSKVEALKRNLLEINPDAYVRALETRIDRHNASQIFKECAIVVEAFDKAEYKSMLVEKLACSGIFVVSASGIAGYGKTDEIKVNRVREGLVVVGDLKTGVDKFPPLSPRVNVAAAKQADIILEYVLTRSV